MEVNGNEGNNSQPTDRHYHRNEHTRAHTLSNREIRKYCDLIGIWSGWSAETECN